MNIEQQVAKWSDEERAEALLTLLKFPLGPATFSAWCASTITCPMEYCIMDPTLEHILLFKRSEDDACFPNQWHVCGSILLPGESAEAVWKRVSTGPKYELKGESFSLPIRIGVQDTLLGPQGLGMCPRGQERNIVHVVIYLGNMRTTENGTWFPLSRLPRSGSEALLGHHLRYIDNILMPWIDSSLRAI